MIPRQSTATKRFFQIVAIVFSSLFSVAITGDY